MQKNFYKSPHCTSGLHCRTCRDKANGRQFRWSVCERYNIGTLDFECPRGRPWGAKRGEDRTQPDILTPCRSCNEVCDVKQFIEARPCYARGWLKRNGCPHGQPQISG